jgi:hypothetical protein
MTSSQIVVIFQRICDMLLKIMVKYLFNRWHQMLYDDLDHPEVDRQTQFKGEFIWLLRIIFVVYHKESLKCLHDQDESRNKARLAFDVLKKQLDGYFKAIGLCPNLVLAGSMTTKTNVGKSDLDVNFAQPDCGDQQKYAECVKHAFGSAYTETEVIDSHHEINKHTVVRGNVVLQDGSKFEVDVKIRTPMYEKNMDEQQRVQSFLSDDKYSAPITFLKIHFKGELEYHLVKWYYYEFVQSSFSDPSIGYIIGQPSFSY